jgi:hypothetical protein
MPCTKYNILLIFYTLKWKQLNIQKGTIFETNDLKMCEEFHEQLHDRIAVKR